MAAGSPASVYRITPDGKSEAIFQPKELQVQALVVDKSGAVYAATNPDGKIYRIANGTTTEYFAPKEHYIWALAVNPSGVLFAATGDQGKIYRVTAAGQGSVFYETGQSNVTGLAFDNQGRRVTLNFILVDGPDGWVITDVESPHDSLRMFLAQYRN